MRQFTLSVLLLAGLSACGGDDSAEQVPAGTEIADNGVAVAPPATMTDNRVAPTATGAGTAFGLTGDQLDDADLVNATGARLGEVETVETDAQGNANALIVEIEGVSPDRRVRLPLTGLTAVANGDDWNLRSPDLTRERLVAMPDVR